MLNLLPNETKVSYAYGRKNVALRRWVAACLIAFLGLGIIATYGLLSLHQSTKNYQQQVASSQTLLQNAKFTQTQASVKTISSSFKLVLQVLSKEVLFSQLLKQIAATIPANANLTGLSINQSQAGIDITAIATDYSTASQVQVNLADPGNKIFSKADITSIVCGTASTATDSSSITNSSTATNSKYPCTVTIRALFASDNPFLLITNNKKAAS